MGQLEQEVQLKEIQIDRHYPWNTVLKQSQKNVKVSYCRVCVDRQHTVKESREDGI